MFSSRGDHSFLGSSWLGAPMVGWYSHHHRLLLPLQMSRPKTVLGGHGCGGKPHSAPWGSTQQLAPRMGLCSAQTPLRRHSHRSLLPLLSVWVCLEAQTCCPSLAPCRGVGDPQHSQRTLTPQKASHLWFLFPAFLHFFYALPFGSCTSVPQAVPHAWVTGMVATDSNFAPLYSSCKGEVTSAGCLHTNGPSLPKQFLLFTKDIGKELLPQQVSICLEAWAAHTPLHKGWEKKK